MLKLKLQYSGHLMRRTDLFEKTPMLGKIEGGRRRGRQRIRWLDGITNSWSLCKLMSIESVVPSNHLILSLPLLLLLSAFPASGSFPVSQFFTSGGQSIGVFSFSISPSNEYSGLISLRMDWLDLLVVQGTPKSLLQHHSSKASVLQGSAFFIVQFSHPYMTSRKTIAFL